MRDGITEIGTIVIAVIVLIFIPMALSYVKAEIITENKASDMLYTTLKEVNSDGTLTLAEADYIVWSSAVLRYPVHMACYSLEGVENGNFGNYIYISSDEQLMQLLEKQGQVILSEGGIIGVYR